MVLTPIAPHTLSNRPVVIPGASRVRIEATRDDARQEVYATFDGQQGCALEPGDVVTVHRCVNPMRLVRATTRNYFEVLRRKLKWAER
jgi:NAD+ kinase